MSTLIKSWWILALRGAISVLFGLVMVAWPSVPLSTLVQLFGLYALADGVACAAFGVAAQENRATFFVAGGLVGVAAGLLALINPGFDSVSFYVLIGAWAVTTGVAELTTASRLLELMPSVHGLVAGGALSLAFGALCIMVRAASVGVLAASIAVYAVLAGAACIAAATRIHRALPPTAAV